MNGLPLFSLMLVTTIFFHGQKLEKQFTSKSTNATLTSTDKVRFDFKANYKNTFKETIEITATLYNDNLDTVYFLTSTCNGTQYSLNYDTSKFVLTPFLNCNASFPSIERILPKGQFDFKAHFKYKTKESNINLGCDFYKIDKSFDLNKIRLYDIYNRQDKNIIWAERTIQ